MEAIILIVVVVAVIAIARLLFSGSDEAAERRIEERAQRHVDHDIIPLVGLGIIGVELFEQDLPFGPDEDLTEYLDDWDEDDDLFG
ncbi:MAG: hypothetical protein OXI41_11990 [Chloroflexota bacterium]|nr:hypothetical protein [Chloroflexota bacterium]MDE2896455.1 hypothetical protein [Chloroflexota bacterium]